MLKFNSTTWTVSVLLFTLAATSSAQYSGGAGTQAAPYKISNVADWLTLMNTSAHWGRYFVLTGDLDVKGMPLSPIGTFSKEFTGVFDGSNHVIRHADILMPNNDGVGLFGYVGEKAQIRNLTVEDVNVTGRDEVGALAGENDGTLTSCHATGWVSGDWQVGGLVGQHSRTIITCHADVSVRASGWDIGGLVGENFEGDITACFAAGSVSGDQVVGGLVGENWGTISTCYASGSVRADSGYVGGLVGRNDPGSLAACYATGLVTTDSEYVGGLVGTTSGRDVIASFWDIETSGQRGSPGGKGLATHQMKSLAVYRNAGWADKGWVMNDGQDYPRLAWEGSGGVSIPGPDVLPFMGSGTASAPYQIKTPSDFALLSWHASVLDKYIVLMDDLNLSGVTLYPIGDLGSFTGVFDGGGHILSHADVNLPGTDFVGLFSYVTWREQIYLNRRGEIRNLGVKDITVAGRHYVGGLVGSIYWGIVTACYVTGSVDGAGSYVGGLMGENNGGTVTACYAGASVHGSGDCVGGLLGSGLLTACYATGSVTGHGDAVGALVGQATAGMVTACFWNVETSAVPGSSGGKGLTASQMRSLTVYRNAGWAGKGWVMKDGQDYPRLAWEGLGGVSIPDANLPPFVGSGTASAPYQIKTPSEFALLSWYSSVLDKHIVLADTLNLSGVTLYPIGDLGSFTGVFDGAGHSLSNTDVNLPGSDFVGLFGCVGRNGQIRNLRGENVAMTGKQNVGGIAGYNVYGQITSCHVDGSVSGLNSVGGMVGWNSYGSLADCSAAIRVKGDQLAVGGLVGENNSASLTACWTTGEVTGQSCVGGLVGQSQSFPTPGTTTPATVTTCWTSANVSGRWYVGGLVGDNSDHVNTCSATGLVTGHGYVGGLMGNSSGNLDTCYATGSVKGSEDNNYIPTSLDIGGLVGKNSGNLKGCYATGSVSGGDGVGGLTGTNSGGATDCYATGPVTGNGNDVGGLVGDNSGSLKSCCARGSVSGVGGILSPEGSGSRVGGLVGNNSGNTTACYAMGGVKGDSWVAGLAGRASTRSLTACYATGPVSGRLYLGGLSGGPFPVSQTACFWDTQTSGLTTSSAGVGKTTDQMKTPTTFISAGWDFVGETANGTDDTWTICEGKDYPRLKWENVQCDQ